MKAFKAYDIRGIYDVDFDRHDVYKIGFFLPKLLKADRVLVGRDVRASSEEIFHSLCEGIRDSGADVDSIGLSTTPMVYYGTASMGYNCSVQITASHNSKEYNGLKISRTGALPVGSDSGLADLERMITEEEVQVSGSPGEIRELDIRESYLEFMGKYRGDYSNLEVAVDCSNGMAGLLIRDLLGDAVHYLYEDLDGSFPNHEPNPLVEENVVDLKALVSEKDCDIGLIFDGDGDRVMFVDDKGRFIPPDLITAVIGKYFLKTEKGAVLHDIRTSRAVPEYIRKLGGTPHMWKVGHSFAKRKLREIHAIYGGELAGHYYFRDFYSCDSGILAGLIVLDLVAGMKKEGESFSDLIDLLRKYPNSGETNFRITEKELAMEALKEHFSKKETPTALFDFDGYRVEFKDWWFNVRPSNTEPFLRLVVEAADKELLSQRLSEIREILKPFSE